VLDTGTDLTRLVERTRGLQPWRRVFHATNGLVVALAPGALGFGRFDVALVLGLMLAVLVAVDATRLRAPGANALFFRTFPGLASPREAVGVASSTWFVLGALLTWTLFPAEVAVPALLVLALADPTAGTLGRLYGRHKIGAGSVEGSLAFFVVASLVLLVTVGGFAAVLVAGAVTVVEATPWRLDDNLSVPLSAGLLLLLLTG